MKQSIILETAFGPYVVDEVIGEGGAGRVYGGTASDGMKVAIKVLAGDRISTDKRRRFKNEIAFLARNKHPNIVTVVDQGFAKEGPISGPFYVMQRYNENLRDVMRRGTDPQEVLPLFSKILDGVEAAHLQGAVHRDLKPENVLFDRGSKTPMIADFGVASFTDDLAVTTVETAPTQRLANFMYAAPEQRVVGKNVGPSADIYALGLILNEMYTGNVPHGTDYDPIGKKHQDLSYLDVVVAKMIRQNSAERYASVQEVKGAIELHHSEFITLQKLSKIDAAVIPAGEVDEPLAHTPPNLVAANWDNGTLTLTLDRPVSPEWVNALHNMGSFTSVYGIPPGLFQFRGRETRVSVDGNSAQKVIDFFKEWLPRATQVLKFNLEQDAKRLEFQRREKLKHEKAAEEQRLKVLRSLRI